MFTIIDRYIGKNILGSIFLILFVFISISGMLKYLDQLRKLQAGYDAFSAVWYVFFSIPKDIELFFPMAALLGALIGLGILASNSELVVMEASGITRLRISFAVMKTAIPLVLLVMAIGEWVAPLGEQTARNMRAQKSYRSTLMAAQGGFWAKDGLNFVYIAQVNNDYTLEGINIYQLNDQHRLEKIIFAKSAHYEKDKKYWILSQIDESDLRDKQQITGEKLLTRQWNTHITPDKLSIVAMRPEALSVTDLRVYINYLHATGQESSKYQLLFWSKIFQPLGVAVMMLLALSFIFGPLRSVSLGIKILTGIVFGFIFYLLDNILGLLCVAFGLPAVLGAILPSIIFLLLSLYLLQKR